MEVDDGFDTAEALKLIEEDILASVFVVKLKNASSGVCVCVCVWLGYIGCCTNGLNFLC